MRCGAGDGEARVKAFMDGIEIPFQIVRILGRPHLKDYGWAIKPDTRGPHPKNVKPRIYEAIRFDNAPHAGAQIVVRGIVSFGD